MQNSSFLPWETSVHQGYHSHFDATQSRQQYRFCALLYSYLGTVFANGWSSHKLHTLLVIRCDQWDFFWLSWSSLPVLYIWWSPVGVWRVWLAGWAPIKSCLVGGRITTFETSVLVFDSSIKCFVIFLIVLILFCIIVVRIGLGVRGFIKSV